MSKASLLQELTRLQQQGQQEAEGTEGGAGGEGVVRGMTNGGFSRECVSNADPLHTYTHIHLL